MHIEIYPRRENHRSYSITAVTAPLYLACQNNDLTDVELCTKKMKCKEIDHQYLTEQQNCSTDSNTKSA
jgi:hypothetical protein